MASPTDRQIADWLVHLAALAPVPGRDPATLAEAIRELTPILRSRYSSAEFDSVSREHVARRCKFFPSYAALCDALDSLPSRQRSPDAVTPDATTNMTENDRHWTSFWHRRHAEIWAQVDGFKRGSRDADMANLASLVRQMSPKAWRMICPESVVIHDRPADAQIVAVAMALRMPGGPLAGRPMPAETQAKPRPSRVSPDELRRMRDSRGVIDAQAAQ